MNRMALALALSAALMMGSAERASTDQVLNWEEGSTFRTFGPNEFITIVLGQINYIPNCPGGTDDFMYPTSRIYIVRSGSVHLGSELTDVDPGAENTIQAAGDGSFTSEQIGITLPSGQIGPGTYAVVYDECENGVFDPEDALFDSAFSVTIPADPPPIIPAILDAKFAAGRQAEYWERMPKYKLMWENLDPEQARFHS